MWATENLMSVNLKWSLACFTLRATWWLLTGRMWPAGRTWCTTGLAELFGYRNACLMSLIVIFSVDIPAINRNHATVVMILAVAWSILIHDDSVRLKGRVVEVLLLGLIKRMIIIKMGQSFSSNEYMYIHTLKGRCRNHHNEWM